MIMIEIRVHTDGLSNDNDNNRSGWGVTALSASFLLKWNSTAFRSYRTGVKTGPRAVGILSTTCRYSLSTWPRFIVAALATDIRVVSKTPKLEI